MHEVQPREHQHPPRRLSSGALRLRAAGTGPALNDRAHYATPEEAPEMDRGRIGYLVLYMMGVPIGILLLLLVLLGNNIFGPG